MSCNTYDAQATKGTTSALTVDQLRSKIYSFDSIIAMQNNPALRYSASDISDSIVLTTANFHDTAQYPFLESRIQQGDITASEYADFLNWSGYSPTQVKAIFSGLNVTSVPVNNYYNQLEMYYNKNFPASISGGFCSAFANALAQFTAMISAGMALISQLKNAVASVIAQLMSIKTILFNIVETLKQTMLQQINNIIDQAMAAIGLPLAVMGFMANKFMKAKEFFSDLNMENLKSKIEEIIAKMAGGFEEITPEALAYMLYRLCQLTEFISQFLQSPVDSIKSMMSNVAMQQITLGNISNLGRARSITAGGYRMDPFEALAARERMAGNVNSANVPGVNAKSYITVPFTNEEWALYNSMTTSGNQYVEFGSQVINQNDPIVSAGVKMIKPEVLLILFRVAKRLGGKKFLINSGYRSPAYNAKQDGAAKNSMHMSGLALDVDMTRFGNITEFRNTFIEYASQEGIGGIGTYNSFIHIDIGPRRIWGSLNSQALSIHRNDKFRSGGSTPSASSQQEVAPSAGTTIPSGVDPSIQNAMNRHNTVPTASSPQGVTDTGGVILDSVNVFGA